MAVQSSETGMVVRSMEALDDLRQVSPLFEGIWLSSGPQVAMPVNLLRALVHSGNYVAGAWRGTNLVGAAVGWIGESNGLLQLHSHIVGVIREAQGHGVGYGLKMHQRSWALDKAIQRITWTYDPLNRRSGWFNLVKIGAPAVAYYPDFYGIMPDRINGTDETDRCFVVWDLHRPLTRPAARSPDADAAILLLTTSNHIPIVHDASMAGAHAVMCQVPEDVVALRRRDPGLAREWRFALRNTMGRAMQDGFAATSMTRDGWYLLRKQPA